MFTIVLHQLVHNQTTHSSSPSLLLLKEELIINISLNDTQSCFKLS